MTDPGRALLLTVAVVLAGCAGRSSGIVPLPETSTAPGWHEGGLAHDGQERRFRFYVPRQLDQGARPVVLLHGGTQGMDELFRPNAGGTQEWPSIAEDGRFLLLVPNGTNVDTGAPDGDDQNWNDCRRPSAGAVTGSTADDVGFVVALVDWARARFPIDARFVVAGASNGGMMAYRLATERPDRVAAIAAFVANLPADGECPAPSRPVPVLIVNGTADPITPFGGGVAGDRGDVVSAEATRDAWLAANGADGSRPETVTLPDVDESDGSTVVCERYPGGARVEFCRVEGGGHTLPSVDHRLPRWLERIVGPQNHDVEGARLAWAFLRRP